MPFNRSLYPHDWMQISQYIRFERAAGQCECTGECGRHEGRCTAEHGKTHPVTGSLVILTTAHLGTGTGDKHDKMDVRPENLKAMCQRCHLLFDLADHLDHALATRSEKTYNAHIEAGQMEMKL